MPSPSRIGLDLIAIEQGAPLDLDLRFESVSEGVLVSGTVHAPTRGECSRCLGPVTGDVEIALTELFAYPDSLTESTTEDDEVGHVVDHTVDLEQPIVDAVGLALPFARCAPRTARDCARSAEWRWPPPSPATSTTRSTRAGPSCRAAALRPDGSADGRFMTPPEDLLDALGIDLPEDLLTLALTHRSYAYENGGLPTNERLELLGDAVLGLVIVEELFRRHPDNSEGDLAKLRNSIVNTQALAGVARELTDDGLGEYLLLGRGEVQHRRPRQAQHPGRHPGVAAGRDLPAARPGGRPAVILRLFEELLDTAPTLGAALEWKSSLQELTSARGLGVPRYEVTSEGPDHDRRFTAVVYVGGELYGRGVGRSKKAAETDAAAQAWTALDAALRLRPTSAADEPDA